MYFGFIIAIFTHLGDLWVDFPIPGNDDARRAIDLYCNLVKVTIDIV